jgi:hypothetical protein
MAAIRFQFLLDLLWAKFLELLSSVPRLANLFVESFRGQFWQFFKDGSAPPELIQKVRAQASRIGFRGTLSLAKIDPQAGVAEITASLKQTIGAIDGFDFLSKPPPGKDRNKHTILLKVGVNWGEFRYPTVTSWESVYVLTKLCYEEAANFGAEIEIIVGDESGIENIIWGHSTRRNLDHAHILHGGILAGLERAACLEESEPDKFKGAKRLLQMVTPGQWISWSSKEMEEMAGRAGVRVIAFDEVDDKSRRYKTIPIQGARHFTQGIPVPRIVDEEATDIINLSKPPGRHMIMGNTGLSGALKNYVGLLASSHRSPGLHGCCDRFPPQLRGQTKESYLESLKARRKAIVEDQSGKARLKFALDVFFTDRAFAPDFPFHEKLAEIYLAFAAKERFCVTDMRRTVSSIGPDVGDTVDIGAIIAARDPLSLDAFAGALLKKSYLEMGSFSEALAPGGDTVLEYLIGRTWLRRGTPFDLMSYIAANSYGLGPVDFQHIDLKGIENSGFNQEEIGTLTKLLQGKQSREGD